MWTETTMRVQAERIEVLERDRDAACERLTGARRQYGALNDAFKLTVEECNRFERERDDARAALAAMTQERDDWKHTANEETRSAEQTIAELTAERDKLRERVGSGLLLTAEARPGGMVVQPLREWTDNQQRTGSVHPGALLDGHRFVGLRLCLTTRGQETLHQLTPATARGIAAALVAVADSVGDV